MHAMVLKEPKKPLEWVETEPPRPGAHDVLVRVSACAVCRTDLHIVDGELPHPKLPLILGHEIVGIVEALGPSVTRLFVGQCVGIPWLGHVCGGCDYCQTQRENLCGEAQFTGYHRDGGYAEYCVADSRFVFPIPSGIDEIHAAPLLCAGLIGFRARMAAGLGRTVGLFGFGAAAHIVAQILVHEGRNVLAFTRPGDTDSQQFARNLGATWAGSAEDTPPVLLDAAIVFAPVGALVPIALGHVKKGGVVVTAGIHMSDIPSFPYALLWGERTLRSVANLTRADGVAFFQLLQSVSVRTEVTPFALRDANRALEALRSGRIRGAAVLVP